MEKRKRKKRNPINTGVLNFSNSEGTNPNIRMFIKNGELWAKLKGFEGTFTSGNIQ